MKEEEKAYYKMEFVPRLEPASLLKQAQKGFDDLIGKKGEPEGGEAKPEEMTREQVAIPCPAPEDEQSRLQKESSNLEDLLKNLRKRHNAEKNAKMKDAFAEEMAAIIKRLTALRLEEAEISARPDIGDEK